MLVGTCHVAVKGTEMPEEQICRRECFETESALVRRFGTGVRDPGRRRAVALAVLLRVSNRRPCAGGGVDGVTLNERGSAEIVH